MGQIEPRKPSRSNKMPLSLEAYLAALPTPKGQEIEALFQAALEESYEVEVADFWESRDIAVTYWVLMISGVNQPEEMEIAKAWLLWKAFFAKDSALVVCLQSSERREFKCASSQFGIVNCPALVLGDSPGMESSIEISSELLFTLSATPGSFQRFLARIHQLVENGTRLEDIRALLWTETFWSGIKVAYAEVKSVVSATVKASVNVK